MDAKTILAAIIERYGHLEISEQEIRKAKGKTIGLVQSWETEERTWKVYAANEKEIPKRTR